MSEAPWWQRRLVEAEKALAPRLTAVLHDENVLIALGLVKTVRSGLERRAEGVSSRALHVLNLPAGSDITRLRTQLAGLERQVRELTKLIEDSGPLRDLEGRHDPPEEVQRRASSSRRGPRPGTP